MVNFRRVGDWTSWSSALVLLCVAPFTVLALSPVILVLSVILYASLSGSFAIWFLVVALAYFALIPLLFLPGARGVRDFFLYREAIQPSIEEAGRLEALWRSVLERVGTGRKKRFDLVVSNESRLNAAAGAGGVVLVTRRALTELDDTQLGAVLAHEYGHHVGLHPIVRIAEVWFVLPIWMVYRLSSALYMRQARRSHRGGHPSVAFFFFMRRVQRRVELFLIRLFLGAVSGVLGHLWRHREYKADLVAVQLGFGRPLVSALQRIDEPPLAVSSLPWPPVERNPLEYTHPPTRFRIARIQEAMQTQSKGQPSASRRGSSRAFLRGFREGFAREFAKASGKGNARTDRPESTSSE